MVDFILNIFTIFIVLVAFARLLSIFTQDKESTKVKNQLYRNDLRYKEQQRDFLKQQGIDDDRSIQQKFKDVSEELFFKFFGYPRTPIESRLSKIWVYLLFGLVIIFVFSIYK